MEKRLQEKYLHRGYEETPLLGSGTTQPEIIEVKNTEQNDLQSEE